MAEHESCATTEGWADYVAAVSWYEPDNFSTVPIAWGFDVEEPIPVDSVCADNGGIELQVAKAFWDLDDWNNEVGGVPVGLTLSMTHTLRYTRVWRSKKACDDAFAIAS